MTLFVVPKSNGARGMYNGYVHSTRGKKSRWGWHAVPTHPQIATDVASGPQNDARIENHCMETTGAHVAGLLWPLSTRLVLISADSARDSCVPCILYFLSLREKPRPGQIGMTCSTDGLSLPPPSDTSSSLRPRPWVSTPRFPRFPRFHGPRIPARGNRDKNAIRGGRGANFMRSMLMLYCPGEDEKSTRVYDHMD